MKIHNSLFLAILFVICLPMKAQLDFDQSLFIDDETKIESIIYISGQLIDRESGTTIVQKGEFLDIRNADDAVLFADFDGKGNYTIALKKAALSELTSLNVQLKGYETLTIKNINKELDYLKVDLSLTTDVSKNRTATAYEQNNQAFGSFKMNF